MTTAHWIVTDQRSWAELLKGYLAKKKGIFVSHDLELERTAPAWTRAWRSPSGSTMAGPEC